MRMRAPLPHIVAVGIPVAGALPAVTPEASEDSDNDGLSDYDEVFLHGTNPWATDTDGDFIPDGTEIAECTAPLDRENFCFVCTACVTNADAVYTNGCCAYLVDEEFIAPVRTFTGSAGVELPHFTVTNGIVPRLVSWIDANSNGVFDIGEPPVTNKLRVTGYCISVSVDLIRRDTDTDRDGIPDVWEVLHGLNPTSAADALSDADADRLFNLHEYWTGCNPHAPDGSNTVLSVMSREIDDHIEGRSPADSLARFLDYAENGTNFVPNANFWAAHVDLSCTSPWNSEWHHTWHAATAISPRHVVLASHFNTPTGTVYYFRGTNGAVHARTLIEKRDVGDRRTFDITIGLLDSDLPACVHPAKILPPDYAEWIGNGFGLPTLTLNQNEEALVAEINPIPADVPSIVSCHTASTAPRRNFAKTVRIGDSSNPRFLLTGNSPVLLHTLWSLGDSNLGGGHSLACVSEEIQLAMDNLCPGYELQMVDLSTHRKLPECGGGQ